MPTGGNWAAVAAASRSELARHAPAIRRGVSGPASARVYAEWPAPPHELDRLLTNQATIVANQERLQANQLKLDTILSNQAILVANQERTLANQEKLDCVLSNQAAILANQEKRVLVNQEKIIENQQAILKK